MSVAGFLVPVLDKLASVTRRIWRFLVQPNQHTSTLPDSSLEWWQKLDIMFATIKTLREDIMADNVKIINEAVTEMNTQFTQLKDALGQVQAAVDKLGLSEKRAADLQTALDAANKIQSDTEAALVPLQAATEQLKSDNPVTEPAPVTEPGLEPAPVTEPDPNLPAAEQPGVTEGSIMPVNPDDRAPAEENATQA